MTVKMMVRFTAMVATLAAPALFQRSLEAQSPLTCSSGVCANAVPFVATTPTAPHPSWSGNQVTLKGSMTSSQLGTDNFTWTWTPGDGTPGCSGTIDTGYNISSQFDNPFVLQCAHTYTGAVNSVFTAVLTVTDTNNNNVSPPVNCPPSITQGACYYVSLNNPPPNLPVEVSNAIENGLWYLHINMRRYSGGVDYGDWYQCNNNNVDECQIGVVSGPTGQNCVAFENSGFLQNTTPPNPYSDDVYRCLNTVFNYTTTIGVTGQVCASEGCYSANLNGTGIGVGASDGPQNYSTGMMLDSIAASVIGGTPPGTPAATYASSLLVPPGTALASQGAGSGTGPGQAFTYADAIYSMVNWYAYCEAPSDNEFGGGNSGGWHYSCQESGGDNSVSGWAAIGIIPARREIGLPVDFDPLASTVLVGDQQWLNDSFTQATPQQGYFGYSSGSPIWGPFADTPSGLVQLAMSGKGRGTTVNGLDLWDPAETFLRDNWDTSYFDGGPGVKEYYYGLLNFTKAMLLHDNNDTGIPAVYPNVNPAGMGSNPLTTLQSMDDPGNCASPGVPITSPGSGIGPCYPPVNWYSAQNSSYGGTDPTNGVARTLVMAQNSDGSWFGHNYSSTQFYLETGFAVTMLDQTVFQPVPVACFTSNPSKLAPGNSTILDGTCSVDNNPANTLQSWQWDISGKANGNFTIGPSNPGGPGNPICLNANCSRIQLDPVPPSPTTPLPYLFPVELLVTDSAHLTGAVIGDVTLAPPPTPPTANAGGPYNFCPNTNAAGQLIYAPWTLNGSQSTNPDQGTTDGTPGAPPSTIVSYLWDYACASNFNSASGEQVDATSAFDVPAYFGTSFNVCLQVTNNDNLAFPSYTLPAGLSGVASAQVTIHNPTDAACTHCVANLAASAAAGAITLSWTDTNSSASFPIASYNVYRSTDPAFGSYTQIAGAVSNPFIPAIPSQAPPAGETLTFTDLAAAGGTTYYYRIAPSTSNGTETCQSNVASALAIQGQPQAATVTFSNLIQTYTGYALSPSVTTNPAGLAFSLTGAPDTNIGSYPVTATITNPNYTGSGNATFQITPIATTTTLLSSPNPSVYAQPVFLIAQVSGANNSIPTGQVQFLNGTTLIGTGTLSGGQASFNPPNPVPAGTYSLTAVYLGATGFSGSTSALLTQIITQATTNTSLASSRNPSTYGQSVTFKATVTSNYGYVPSGETVTFYDGGSSIGTGTTNAGGIAYFTTASLNAGSHSITAAYSGDANHTSSSGGLPYNQAVNRASTTTTLVSSVNPAMWAQPVTFTATVSASGVTPTGTVQFLNGSTPIGTGILSGGVVTFTISTLPVGTDSITAVYGQTTNFFGSTSSAVSQVVNQAVTTTTATSSKNPSNSGQAIGLLAAVTSAYAIPTGTVTFYYGSITLGTATLVSGKAGIIVSTLPKGSDTIKAVYGVTTDFKGSSGSFVQKVN